ncbi:uncharacterized protein LOC129232676 [Uloborus diversus]|uniref:uncharacterized protein LOC129232676 n=1 Tax=Uloborus diversus TaxID=327109 RepID=UPI002409D7B7|nr:uncharacterized protein LOC129232676 [Uloborus diversus]
MKPAAYPWIPMTLHPAQTTQAIQNCVSSWMKFSVLRNENVSCSIPYQYWQTRHLLWGENKPPEGFLYSLKKEACSFQLERSFVASLLANAFFSDFPRRSTKTHPTLQDFGMADFFTNLNKRSHQKKLKAFLRYFEKLEEEPKGNINFVRKVVTGPSLPGWLCSDRPLVPLVVRTKGSALEAETRVFRACSCTSLIGGDVLKTSTSQEARLFFSFPELLACLCFVESLGDGEALLVEGVRIYSKQLMCQDSTTPELNFSLLECPDFSSEPNIQFSDVSLLQALNRALAAFLHEPRQDEERRHTPVGESSGEETRDKKRKQNEEYSSERKKGYLPLIEQKSSSRRSSASSECQKSTRKKTSVRNNSHSSSRLSMKTASQSSMELPPIRHTREEEFYTADEDSGDGSEAATRTKLRREKRASVAMNDLLREDSSTDPMRRSSHRRSSSTQSFDASLSSDGRSGSVGFVLGGESEDDWPSVGGGFEAHERLEDFRKRIRKRTRRKLSRRGSSSYMAGSSGSSDMEDISEDPEEWSGGEDKGRPRYLRPTSSEPLLFAPPEETLHSPSAKLPLSPEALFSLGSKKVMMATSSSGYLKAYSYDGVSPNLPVPFKAKFRRRRRHNSEEGDISLDGQLMMERSSSLEDLSSCSHSGRRKASTAHSEPVSSRCPVAAEPCSGDGDSQLKSIILWLAASMARLPTLIIYTQQEPQLNELTSVYNKVLSRQWTIGDLSCEVLRFCRNRISPRHPMGISSRLFGQLIGSESSASSLSYNMSQQSLD